jgi:putative hemolysin
MFSASETALSSLGKLEIQSIIAKGGWRAKTVQYWIRDPNRALTTVLIGNNVANIVSSSLLTLWISHRLGELQTTIAMAIFTVSFIILSEIVPKILARHHSIVLAPPSMRFLQIVSLMLAPVVFIIHRASAGIVFLLGIRRADFAKQTISEDDLTATIEIAAKEGGIDRETGEVLSNLI